MLEVLFNLLFDLIFSIISVFQPQAVMINIKKQGGDCQDVFKAGCIMQAKVNNKITFNKHTVLQVLGCDLKKMGEQNMAAWSLYHQKINI